MVMLFILSVVILLLLHIYPIYVELKLRVNEWVITINIINYISEWIPLTSLSYIYLKRVSCIEGCVVKKEDGVWRALMCSPTPVRG